MTAFYNEHDPYAAAWLRNLIAAGHIAPGVVDESDIRDLTPDDVRQFTQCHFFAGIGVWSYALRRAGWPDDRPVWTGSCPCQPFSAAGAGAGFADERHLWPHFNHLIDQCRPAIVLGEQVASKDADPWIDLVQADMEAVDYAFGCVPFPAASVGAPHIRDRNYWVATGGMADIDSTGRGAGQWHHSPSRHGDTAAAASDTRRLDDDDDARSQGHAGDGGRGGRRSGAPRSASEAGVSDGLEYSDGGLGHNGGPQSGRPGPTNGFWESADWLFCRDAKWRPVEPGTFPLAHGAASRVGRLRAYGNAIVAVQAEEFIRAVMSCA